MHVGRHRASNLLSNFPEDIQTMVEAVSPKTPSAGPIGFVEGRFENVIDAKPIADSLDHFRDLKTQFQRLNYTGTSDQEQLV